MQGVTVAAGLSEIAARMDRLATSRYLWRLVVLLSLGGFFEMYDLLMTAYVSPGLYSSGTFREGREAVLGLSDQAAFAASTFAGLWVGTLALGALADRFGRRFIFTFSLLWYAAATLAMCAQHTAAEIFFWRFIAGIGIGVELVTIDTYLSELVPCRVRGKAFAICQGIQFCAVPLAALLSWLLILHKPLGMEGWRWVAAFPVLGAVIVWWIRRQLPESPRWLALQGRLEEARRLVSDIEERVSRDLGHALQPPVQVLAHAPPAACWRAIFRPPYRRYTLMLVVFNFFQTIGFYGFGNWVPKLISSQGIDITSSLKYAFIVAIVYPIGPFLFSLFADRFERKWQIVVAALCTATFGLLFAKQTDPGLIITLGVLITASQNLMSSAYHAYQAELFPTHLRARAIGFVYSFSRLSTALTSFMIAYFLHRFGTPGVFAFVAVSMLMVIVAIGGFGPATGGRSLEEIQSGECKLRKEPCSAVQPAR